MKNVIKKSILLATVFASMVVSANEISTRIVNIDAKATSFTLNNVKEGNLLTIKDTEGVVLYKELIKISGTYKKGFDLSELPNGDYFFEVEKDFEIKTIPFKVNTNNVEFNKAMEKTTFKPVINHKSNLVFINKLTPELEAVKIKIYSTTNNENVLLHSEKIEGSQKVERVYKLEKGNYTIVINSDNKEYTKFINN